MPTLTTQIRKGSPLHELVRKEVRRRVKLSEREFSDLRTVWGDAEDEALAYLPERDADSKRRIKREQEGLPQYTTLKVPYSYAVLMASHTYWANVFLGRAPVFQYSARHGEGQQSVLAMEALIGYQYKVGRISPALYSWLYDVGRYGLGVIGHWWDEEILRYTEIEEVVEVDPLTGETTPTGRQEQVTSEIDGYKGNRAYNVRPADFLPDPRVTFRDFQKGEYCGVRKRVGWAEMKRRERNGFYTNLQDIDRDIREDFLDRFEDSEIKLPSKGVFDGQFTEFRGDQRKHPDLVPLYEVYVELTPKEWKGLGNSDFPEKWVFSVTADFQTVVGAQPLGLRHGRFPFEVIEIEPDAYTLGNRGIPQILDPVSRTVDWLLNSHFYNVRAILNNQVIVDPSRLVMKDVLDPVPGGVWRMKPAAYGTDVKSAFAQVPVTDVTQAHVNDISTMINIGERVIGVNDQILGALQQGGRKTATEVRSSTTFGVNRLKTTAEYMSETGWDLLSQSLVQNSQQFYESDLALRIVGNLSQTSNPENYINVSPENITGFYDFVPVDGTLPVDRLAQASLFKDLLAQLRQFPQLAAELDITKMVMWTMQLTGIRNVDQFRVEVIPDDVGQPPGTIPIRPNGAGAGSANSQGLPTPTQISGIGPAS